MDINSYLETNCKRITFLQAEHIFSNALGFVCSDGYIVCSDGNKNSYYLSQGTFPKCLRKGPVDLNFKVDRPWYILTLKDIIMIKGFTPTLFVKEIIHKIKSNSRDNSIDLDDLIVSSFELKVPLNDLLNPVKSPEIWREYFNRM